LRRSRRRPSVLPIAQICRPVAGSDVVAGHGFCNHEEQQLEIGVGGVARFVESERLRLGRADARIRVTAEPSELAAGGLWRGWRALGWRTARVSEPLREIGATRNAAR
jgi:hypothetical protein